MKTLKNSADGYQRSFETRVCAAAPTRTGRAPSPCHYFMRALAELLQTTRGEDAAYYGDISIGALPYFFLFKGRKHLLVVSRQDGLDSIEDLRSSHLSLLEHMHTLGQKWVQSLLDQDQSLAFRMGYHSDPSMRQLHMHIISQDFNSPSLKNKKHWNSFTTTFFRDSKGLIEELESRGRVKPCGDESSLVKLELRCHKC